MNDDLSCHYYNAGRQELKDWIGVSFRGDYLQSNDDEAEKEDEGKWR